MKCWNCNKREGMIQWGEALAVSHGWAQMWCEYCVLRKQIEHVEERVAALPELRRRLAELND